MEFKDTSDDTTEQLCDSTIDLMKCFENMLMEMKSRRQPEVPCQCNRGQSRSQKKQDKQRQHQQQPTVCSNASNLAASHGRVAASPDEIPLRLRLESWISDNGVLVVKPSVHRECSSEPRQKLLLTAANNNTAAAAAAKPAAPLPAATLNTIEDGAGDFDETASECADTEENELQLQQHLCHHLQQQQPGRRQHQSASLKTPAAGSAARRRQQQPPPQPQPQPAHRRERQQVKRHDGSAAAAAKPGPSSARNHREAAQTSRGETLALLRDLHRLLSVEHELKRSAE